MGDKQVKKAMQNHTPWRLVHLVIAGLVAVKSMVAGVLFLTLGVAVN